MSQTIDPTRLYTPGEVRDLIPGVGGKRLHAGTISKWVKKGLLVPQVTATGRRLFLGSEILRFLGLKEAPVWKGETPAQRRRAVEAADRQADALGL